MYPDIKEEDRVQDKIPLRSPEGQRMLEETPARQMLLVRLFKEQENNTFCGIQSSALLMSARHLGLNSPEAVTHATCEIGDTPYREDNMFAFEATRGALDYEECDREGATMPQIYDLLRAHGLPVRKVHANQSCVGEFRELASAALAEASSQKGVMVNYDEYFLGQDDKVRGHFSVLAAYHSGSDRFLLLDTYFNTTDCWVKAEDLFMCMNTVDKAAGMHRGFMIVG